MQMNEMMDPLGPFLNERRHPGYTERDESLKAKSVSSIDRPYLSTFKKSHQGHAAFPGPFFYRLIVARTLKRSAHKKTTGIA